MEGEREERRERASSSETPRENLGGRGVEGGREGGREWG